MGPTPYTEFSILLKITLIPIVGGLVAHFLRTKFSAWSFQIGFIATLGSMIAAVVYLWVPRVGIGAQIATNKVACICMTPNPKEIKACSRWIKGEAMKYKLASLVLFQDLPQGTRDAITKNLAPNQPSSNSVETGVLPK